MKKFIVVVIIIAVLIAAFFGIKSLFNNNTSKDETDKPNEIIYKLVSIERMDELPGDVSAKKGKEWLVITVFGENHDTEKRLYNMYYFTFKDEDGNVFENSPNTLNSAIKYGVLPSKGTINGSIVFQVPEGAKGKLLITDEKFNEIQELDIKKK